MRGMRLHTAWLVIIFGACAGVTLFHSGPSHTHKFGHKQHTVDNNIDCTLCHYAVETNGVEKFGMLPQMADCLLCHQVEFDQKNCSYCHQTKEPGPLQVPARDHLHYNHPQHAQLKDWNRDCLACHNQAHTATKAGMKKMPKMQLCLECHQTWFNRLECLNCHNGFEKLGTKPLSEFSHTGNFTETHAAVARGNLRLCAQCHEEQYCNDCHQQENVGLPPDLKYPDVTRRHWVHEGDFLTRHFLEARFNSGQCIKCHAQAFCRNCHEIEGIADIFPGSRTDMTADPHPLGFGFREDPTSPNFHGRIARREIFSCAGCHDNGADTICLECHSTVEKGGWGINPHPLGFTSRLGKTRDRVCLACHVRQ